MTDTEFQKREAEKREKALNLVNILADFKQHGEDGFDAFQDDDAVTAMDWVIDEARSIVR